jgi:transcriptional regulatory protein RtcR
LLARINLWTFELPGLRERPEDFEPNFDYELERFSSRTGNRVTINKEARELFLDFAVSGRALWTANFRDLGGAVTRMATLATNGRITVREVREEIRCLERRWRGTSTSKKESGSRLSTANLTAIIGREKLDQLDLFDQAALEKVVEICRSSATIADAGRTLFNRSRLKKSTLNDSDRLRKYLAKFDLDWRQVAG